MVTHGETFTEKKAAGSALLEECHNMKSPDPVPLGQYRGFAMELYFRDVVDKTKQKAESRNDKFEYRKLHLRRT